MKRYGLIGFPLGHSFSGKYFREKFLRDSISDCLYSNFEISSIQQLPDLLNDSQLLGLNVTIPYKQEVISFLDVQDPVVAETGACNCIRIKNGTLHGFNTDVIGFKKSLLSKLLAGDRQALILGTGGSSRAVAWVLKQMGIGMLWVSRNRSALSDHIVYEDLNREIIRSHKLIINTTPVGMFPKIMDSPSIPYEFLSKEHYLFDLVYNPEKTVFLQQGENAGARIKNGADMLAIQAEASWDIWND